MEYADIIIRQIIANFDFAFMFIINVLVYLVIKLVSAIAKTKPVTKKQKRFILVVCTVLIAIVYKWSGYDSNISLINSAILAPVFYSWVLRPLLIKLRIEHKGYDETFG